MFPSAEHEEFRTFVQASLARIVLPHASDWEARRCVPPTGWRALGEEGLLSLGHRDQDFLRSAVFLEELGATGYAGIRAAVGVHAYMALSYVDLFGTEEQRGRYLPPARRGEWVAALAITEDAAGSDLRHIATTARPRNEGGYLLNGEKTFVANGSQAGFYVVLARTAPATSARGLTGASLIIVDSDSPGLHHEARSMVGWRASDVCRVELRDVPVPPDRLIGRPGRALSYLMRALDFERLVAGLLAMGGVRHCLDVLCRFVRAHRVADAPLSAKQAVRQRIAELSAEFEMVRRYAYHAAWLHSRSELDTRTASILKVTATDLAVAAAQTCLQYHGARGYVDDSTAARIYRDAMAGTIAAGANELLREMIFETIPPERSVQN